MPFAHTGRQRNGPRGTGRASGAWARRRLPKRLLDLAVGVSALLVLGVVMLVVAAVIRLTSPGPALFRQVRIGKDHQPFVMFKFRTMRSGSSDEVHREYVRSMLAGEISSVDGLYKLDRDPRITPVGALLRRLSLDELPQLLNVLRGEMSLVGPRPALPWELELLPAWAEPRFRVPPGLTGLWQVSGRNRLTMLRAVELDVEYASHSSFWTDLKILLLTVPALLRGENR